MSKIFYNSDKINKEIIVHINNIIKNFDLIDRYIKEMDIPIDFTYRDFLLNIADSMEEYRSILQGTIEKIGMFEYEISNMEQSMFQDLNKIDDLYYNEDII